MLRQLGTRLSPLDADANAAAFATCETRAHKCVCAAFQFGLKCKRARSQIQPALLASIFYLLLSTAHTHREREKIHKTRMEKPMPNARYESLSRKAR